MGTFERIRKVSPYALGVFVVVFIGFMVLSDADIGTVINQGQNPLTAPIGMVNGEEFLYKDYEERVKQAVEQQRSQSEDPNAEIDENQIRTQIWDQMVNELLLKQEAEKVGITVTDAEVADILIENPPDYLARSFTDSAGNFNRQTYLDLVTNPENIVNYMGQDPTQIDPEERDKAIANLRNDLINIGNFIRQQKMQEALNSVVTAASSQISPLFAKSSFKEENSVADVSFIHLSIRDISMEEATVSDDEVRKYYDENKKYYRQKYQRKIKYLNLPIEPSADDSARADRRVQKILEDLQKGLDLASTDSIFDIKMSEYSGTQTQWQMFQDIDPMKAAYVANAPDRQVVGPVRLPDGIYFLRLDGRRSGENVVVKASHVLVGFGANNNKDSARKEADKILRRARSGEDFAKLAIELSEDKGSGAQGGDLGYFGKGRMVKPFEDAAFAASPGSIVGPVESQFGFHIIKVTDKKSDELQYSEIKISPNISNPTRNKILMDAHSFVKQFETGVSFDTLAARMNQPADTSDFIPKAFPIFNSWALTNQIFDAEIGAILQPKEIKSQGIVVIQVIGERKEGPAEFDAVAKEIRELLVKRKQLDLLKDKAANVFSKVKSFANLSEVTEFEVRQAPDLKTTGSVPGIGLDIQFAAQALKAETGKILEPIRGSNGWYIVQVNSKQIPDDNIVNESVEMQTRKLKQVAKNQVFNAWYNKMKETAKIEDLRSNFYSEY